jgi:hypothetical protein
MSSYSSSQTDVGSTQPKCSKGDKPIETAHKWRNLADQRTIGALTATTKNFDRIETVETA